MHTGTSSDTALRRALLLDAAATVAMGLLLAAAAGSLAGLLGLPAGLLRWAGLFLVPFAAVLALVAKRPTVSGPATVILIACNVLWAVAAFAALEYAGLRRAAALA